MNAAIYLWAGSTILMVGCSTPTVVQMPLLPAEETFPRPSVENIAFGDPSKIEATLAQRRAWVGEQRRVNRKRFEEDYDNPLSLKPLGENGARQVAYLFFYSSGQMCGYFDRPTRQGAVWKFAFHSGFEGSRANAVYVDQDTGYVWQEGQSVKLDAIGLLKWK